MNDNKKKCYVYIKALVQNIIHDEKICTLMVLYMYVMKVK